MLPQVTVVIPTYNGARRLPMILRQLRAQDAADGSFEVVVIDNNSTDDTATVASNDASVAALRARGIECRVVGELRQGLSFARVAGVLAARAPLVCFLDDDNLPASDYIRHGVSALNDQGIGLLISNITPQWESEPPPSIARRSALFALNGYSGNYGYLGEFANRLRHHGVRSYSRSGDVGAPRCVSHRHNRERSRCVAARAAAPRQGNC